VYGFKSELHRNLANVAQRRAIPITFGPRLLRLTIPLNGKMLEVSLPETVADLGYGTGFILQLSSGRFVVTARHVLKRGDGKGASYEERVFAGEALDWYVGRKHLDQPLSRVAWDGFVQPWSGNIDIVLLKISEAEAREVLGESEEMPFSSAEWPPTLPRERDMVFLAGFPQIEVKRNGGRIRRNCWAAFAEVTSVSANL
jgi:Trypsin-like peptidase domain